MECPNCKALMHFDGDIWECWFCGETAEDCERYEGEPDDWDGPEPEAYDPPLIDWSEFEQGLF